MKLHGRVILALINNGINSPTGGGSRQEAETWSDGRQLPGQGGSRQSWEQEIKLRISDLRWDATNNLAESMCNAGA